MEIERGTYELYVADAWDEGGKLWISIDGPGVCPQRTYWLNRDELDQLIEHLVEVRDGNRT